MRCEVCGNVIAGPSIKVRIEGTTMLTCSKCAALGDRVGKPDVRSRIKPLAFKRKKPYLMREEILDIVEGYDKIIRAGRERMGMTQKDLGMAVNEKMSVISRLESGRMVPENRLAKKLEKVLNIKLLEAVENEDEVGL